MTYILEELSTKYNMSELILDQIFFQLILQAKTDKGIGNRLITDS